MFTQLLNYGAPPYIWVQHYLQVKSSLMLSVPEEISLCCDFFVFVVDVVQRPLFLVGGKSSPMVSGEQALLLDLASLSPHDMVSSFFLLLCELV